MVVKGALAIAPYLCHQLIELDHVFVHPLIVLYLKVIQLVFGFSN